MLKRTLYFSRPTYFKVKEKQLVYEFTKSYEKDSCPIEDLGFIVLDNPQITLSQRSLADLSKNNTAVIICGPNHMPNGILLSLDANHQQGKIIDSQINCSQAQKKQLWKEIVKQKIINQQNLLNKLSLNSKGFKPLIQGVKSGDPDNREAQAARLYWPRLFESNFKRTRDGLPPNNLLNYGYMILRASCARAIVGSGLFPSFGLHHCNQYNSFRLADDLMEPYRPFVDETVYLLYKKGITDLNPDSKKELLRVLTCDTQFKKCKRPLSIGLTFTTASLVKILKKEEKVLALPEFQ